MGIFDLFKNKKQVQIIPSQTTVEGSTIFYHEDDFLQVEILPDNNFEELMKESKEVEDFAEKHSDGSGYTDIYGRDKKKRIELKDRQINPLVLEQFFSQLGFERISNVFTGYGQSFRELHKNCIAFGKDYTAVYFDFKDNVVQHIWLTNHWSMDKIKLSKCLHEIGAQWNLLLQDWNLTITIDLKNMNAIDNYLRTYADQTAE